MEIKNIFLPNLIQKSEESISFLIGNKVDLNYVNEDLKSEIKRSSLSHIPFSLVSAKNQFNIVEAFHFIIYSYLKENEEFFKNQGIKKLPEFFLKHIGKKEEDLKNFCFNTDEMSSIKFQKSKIVEIKQKEIPPDEKNYEIDYFIENLKDIDILREEIKKSYQQNILFVKDMIDGLGKTPIHLLMDTIEETKIHLNGLQEDFQQKLDIMISLDNLLTKKLKEK